jgi:hypothetical protein
MASDPEEKQFAQTVREAAGADDREGRRAFALEVDLTDLAAEVEDLSDLALSPHRHDRIQASDLFDGSVMPRVPPRVALARKARRARKRADRLEHLLSELSISQKERQLL